MRTPSRRGVAQAVTKVAVLTVVGMVAALGAHAGAAVDTARVGSQNLAQLAAVIAPVTNLQATGAAGHWVVLSWDNPTGATIDRIEIRFSTADFPQSVNEGTDPDPENDPGGEDLDPGDDEWTIRGLDNHVPYFFSVFTSTDAGATWSPPVTVRQRPYVCPKVSFAISAPPGVIQEKLWTACSGPMAVDAHNTLDTLLDRDGEQALMTTGSRTFAVPPGADDQGANNNTGYRDAFDVSVLRLLLQIPDGKHCLRFDYVFATEGDPAVGGVERDAFLVHKNTLDWEVSEPTGGTLDPGTNVAALTDGNYVGLGSAVMGSGATLIGPGTGPAQNGSGYDLMTPQMNVSVPVSPQTTPRLFLSIFDRGASDIRDSAVFVDRLRLLDANCDARTNRWPTAVNDTASTESGDPSQPIDLLENDTDPDGDALSFVITSGPGHGSLDCAATCEYTSDPGFIGTDTFTYRVADGNGGTDTATASVQVTAPSSQATLAISKGVVKWPAQVNVSGELRVGGSPAAAGVEVQLMAGPNLANLRSVGTTETDADGTMSRLHRPAKKTVYQWRVAGTDVVSGTRTVQVAPALTVGVTKPALAVGDTTQIKGKTSPSRKGTPVLLQRWNGTSWVTVQQTTVTKATRTLKPSGPFAFSVKARASGVAKFRVVVQADAGRLQAVSPTRQVTVYDARITKVSKTADEFVVVKNTGKVRLNIKGWKLVNKKGASVTLPKRLIAVGKVLKIHTGSGNSNLKNLYLGRGAMFNNTHDRVSLMDRNKFLVSRFTY